MKKLKCACGCGKVLTEKPWHKYRPIRFISGHNVPRRNYVSFLDDTKDTRKNQTGFLATKMVANIRHDAKKAGYEWAISDLFVFSLIVKDCTYCGTPSGWPNGRNGIDRVDSSIGYVEANCVSCCKTCNRAKSNGSVAELREWVIRFYNFLKHKGMLESNE